MEPTGQRIIEEAKSLPEGTVLSAKAFLHLGSRAAIDQALARLARSGELLRVERGRYVLPVNTRFGSRAPAPEKVVERLAEATGETVVPAGAAAANALGVTTQVPVRPVYLTSGRSRFIRVGRHVVELKHAPAWQLRSSHQLAGQAIRALAWLGPVHAKKAAVRLKNALPEAACESILSARPLLPSWLAQTVSETFRPALSPPHGRRA